MPKLILGYLEERFYPLLIEKGLQIPYRFRIGIVQKPVKDKESLSEARIAYEFKPEWWEQFQEKVSAVEFDNFERDLYSNPIKSPE